MEIDQKPCIVFLTLFLVVFLNQNILLAAILSYSAVKVAANLMEAFNWLPWFQKLILALSELAKDTFGLPDTNLLCQEGSKKQKKKDIPKFRSIMDRFETLADVSKGLRESGVESAQLIVAVDFTKSNENNGENTYRGRCLHSTSCDDQPNPYLDASQTLISALEPFVDSGGIHAIGFGDSRTRDHSVFALSDPSRIWHSRSCEDITSHTVIPIAKLPETYYNAAKTVHLSGPTSLSPAMAYAMHRATRNPRQLFVLVILTDGETSYPNFDAKTLCDLSDHAVSVVCVGIGDGGPNGRAWGIMKEFDDEVPDRNFDNFQFVKFSDYTGSKNKEILFARDALMEVPDQNEEMRIRNFFALDGSKKILNRRKDSRK